MRGHGGEVRQNLPGPGASVYLAVFLTILTLLLGTLGAAVGYAWSLPSLVSGVGFTDKADLLWVLGWTAIGSIQGACMAPAFCLGQGREMYGWSRLILCAGSLATSLVALSVWQALGRGKELSLAIACGLSLMSIAPLLAYTLARRPRAPRQPAGI